MRELYREEQNYDTDRYTFRFGFFRACAVRDDHDLRSVISVRTI